jgi:hypothetical protein
MYKSVVGSTLATSSTGPLLNGITANDFDGEALEIPLGGVIWSSMSPNNRLPRDFSQSFWHSWPRWARRQSKVLATWGRGDDAGMLGVGGTSYRWWRRREFEESVMEG